MKEPTGVIEDVNAKDAEKTLTENKPPIIAEFEAAAKKAGFDVDAAMNTDGFLEFMAKHPDAGNLDMEDTEALSRRFEAFKVKDAVTEEMKRFTAENIKRETGMNIPDSVMTGVGTKMELMAVTDPDRFLAIKQMLESTKSLPMEIANLEGKLKELGNEQELTGNLETLQVRKEKIALVAEHAGRWGRMKLWTTMIANRLPEFAAVFDSAARIKESMAERAPKAEEAAEKVKNIAELEAEKGGLTLFGPEMGEVSEATDSAIASIELALSQIKDAKELKSSGEQLYGTLRGTLLGGIADFGEIQKFIQAEAKRILQETVVKGDVTSLEQALAVYEDLNRASAATETGIDYLAAVNKENFEQHVDRAIQRRAFEELMQSVTKTKLGGNALGNLEKTLDGWLKREKIGTKKGDEARQFIRKALEEVRDGLSSDQGDLARKMMLSRILIKIKR